MIVRPVLCRAFIGRRDELAYLHERRREAASSHGGCVLIAGDAGVGKSRLISEFCAPLAYSRWLIAKATCREFGGQPYGAVSETLSRIDPQFSGIVPAASRQQQIDALVERFEAVSARKGTIIIVEDLHWADTATLDALTSLGTKLQSMRALLIASYRLEDLTPEHFATTRIATLTRYASAGTIQLAPLAGVELRAFIDGALSGISLPDTARRAIARVAEGNPYLTEELLKNAVERSTRNDSAPIDIPKTLRATLLERLRPFDDDERRIIAQAAVIGRTFSLELLASTIATDGEYTLSALRRARDYQLIEEVAPMRFRFRHALTREAIYGGFLDSELRPMHKTLAIALERAPEAERSIEQLAYHWWACGDDARSTHYNELAGDEAAHVYAHEAAIAFYERALDAKCLGSKTRGSLLEKIAEARIALTWTDEAQRTYAAAAEFFSEAGDYEREATCRVQAAIMAYTSGMPEPTAPLEALLARLDQRHYLARSRVHLGLAWLAATFWFPSRASKHLEHVDPRAIAEANDIELRFHNISAWVAMTFGDVERFVREHTAWVERARAMKSVRGIVAAHLNGAMCFSFFGMHELALQHLDAAFRDAKTARNPYAEENCNAFAALCHLMRGDLARARASVQAIPVSTENHVNFTFATAWGTIVAAHLGDDEMMRKWFDGIDSKVRKLEIESGAGVAEILVRRNRQDEAAALLHDVLPECELMRGNVLTLLAIGRYGRPEDRETARTYLSRAAQAPTELPERPALALFDAFEHQRRGDDGETSLLARAAAEGFHRLRLPLLEAAAWELAGEIASAEAIYRRCGAVYHVQRLSGANGASESEILSEREREVANRAARGDSNLEIARDLSISHKTVEKHLASIFGKLGISSRRGLRNRSTTIK